MMNELGLAKQIAAGELQSPYPVPGTNYILIALRITGTGYAYRSKSKSFVYRDPDDYLTDNVLDMCNGLPVIIEHEEDKKGINEDTEAIGTVFYPYINLDEIWAIAKIWKVDELENIIDDERISTSPSFICKTQLLENQADLVRQDLAPISCNHIAILPNGLMGVWDKYDPESQAIHLFNDSQEVETMPDPVEGAVQENGGGDTATLEKLFTLNQQVLDGLTALAARVDKIEAGGKDEAVPPPAEATPTPPAPKADAAEAVVEPEATPAEPTIAELAEKIKAMDAASYGNDDDMQEKAELLDDAENLHYMFKTPLIKSPGTESVGALRRRVFKAECEAAKTLGINSPWLNEAVEILNDSTLAIAHSQLKTQIFAAKPKAEAGQAFMSFVKKGKSGLANETHFVVGDKSAYFQSH
jgi:hypothetical protein